MNKIKEFLKTCVIVVGMFLVFGLIVMSMLAELGFRWWI